MYRSSPDSLPPLVITAFNGTVVALRTADGGEAWRKRVGGPTVRIAVTAERVVAAGSSYCVVLDYATGTVLSSIKLRGPTSTLLVVGTRAFVARTGEMTCIGLDEGRALWSTTLTDAGSAALAIAVPGLMEQGDRVTGS